MKTKTIESNLQFANRALTNSSQSTPIKEALADYGYDEQRFQEGFLLYEKANDLYVQQIKEYSDKYSASQTLRDIYEEASDLYMKHVKLARIAMRDDFDLYLRLKLKGKREKSYDKWFAQANAFYTLALENRDVQNALAFVGITRDKLKEGHALIQKFQKQANVRSVELSEAQKATLLRDEAMEELNQWVSDLIAISQIALEDDPQELEKLGLVM